MLLQVFMRSASDESKKADQAAGLGVDSHTFLSSCPLATKAVEMIEKKIKIISKCALKLSSTYTDFSREHFSFRVLKRKDAQTARN
jgi:hypothetical protein